MGKYTDQASSYKMGMNSLQASLEDIILEIEKVGNLIKEEDSKDALNYYVSSSNDDIKEAIDSLNLKCTSIPFSIMQKAGEIDRRIELEQQEALRIQQEETENKETTQVETSNTTSLRKERDTILRTDISSKMGW